MQSGRLRVRLVSDGEESVVVTHELYAMQWTRNGLSGDLQ